MADGGSGFSKESGTVPHASILRDRLSVPCTDHADLCLTCEIEGKYVSSLPSWWFTGHDPPRGRTQVGDSFLLVKGEGVELQ